MPDFAKVVANSELLEKIFGRWPSFHDAEIHGILLTRAGDAGARMDVTIHHWTMTKEVDAKGYFILKNHTLTTLRFSGISDLQMAGFNHQNVLLDLGISELDPGSGARFGIAMPTSYGCEASFKCMEVRVLSAEPYGKL